MDIKNINEKYWFIQIYIYGYKYNNRYIWKKKIMFEIGMLVFILIYIIYIYFFYIYKSIIIVD